MKISKSIIISKVVTSSTLILSMAFLSSCSSTRPVETTPVKIEVKKPQPIVVKPKVVEEPTIIKKDIAVVEDSTTIHEIISKLGQPQEVFPDGKGSTIQYHTTDSGDFINLKYTTRLGVVYNYKINPKDYKGSSVSFDFDESGKLVGFHN